MMDSPEKTDIPNPLAQYTTVCLDPNKPHDVYINLELIGDNSESVRISFNDHAALGAIAELLWEAAVDLYEGQEFGIEHLTKIKGVMTDRELTVEDVLSGNGSDVAPHREDIAHPWDIPLSFELAQWMEEVQLLGSVELHIGTDEISVRQLTDGTLLWQHYRR
jgi:hypothetical protein